MTIELPSDKIWNKLQVPPAELEHLLQSNPEIADAAVVPYVSNPVIFVHL